MDGYLDESIGLWKKGGFECSIAIVKDEKFKFCVHNKHAVGVVLTRLQCTSSLCCLGSLWNFSKLDPMKKIDNKVVVVTNKKQTPPQRTTTLLVL